ncbi:hypothetical protein C4D60_Mb07t12200 [Musa balbisiana]|uniref:Uncharacterized protein n=1 Tax=Musa balbisiana TaxID=52838 RepID=A0A4S8JER1_MUSBA|nr:hypothetical protein C4D60_Mb07t12200 [Musa balbisiana]
MEASCRSESSGAAALRGGVPRGGDCLGRGKISPLASSSGYLGEANIKLYQKTWMVVRQMTMRKTRMRMEMITKMTEAKISQGGE